MTVAELIQKLNQFPQDMEVKITDGFNLNFYGGDFTVEVFEDFVDIGIGGCEIEE